MRALTLWLLTLTAALAQPDEAARRSATFNATALVFALGTCRHYAVNEAAATAAAAFVREHVAPEELVIWQADALARLLDLADDPVTRCDLIFERSLGETGALGSQLPPGTWAMRKR